MPPGVGPGRAVGGVGQIELARAADGASAPCSRERSKSRPTITRFSRPVSFSSTAPTAGQPDLLADPAGSCATSIPSDLGPARIGRASVVRIRTRGLARAVRAEQPEHGPLLAPRGPPRPAPGFRRSASRPPRPGSPELPRPQLWGLPGPATSRSFDPQERCPIPRGGVSPRRLFATRVRPVRAGSAAVAVRRVARAAAGAERRAGLVLGRRPAACTCRSPRKSSGPPRMAVASVGTAGSSSGPDLGCVRSAPVGAARDHLSSARRDPPCPDRSTACAPRRRRREAPAGTRPRAGIAPRRS